MGWKEGSERRGVGFVGVFQFFVKTIRGGGLREEGGGEREGCGVLKGEERGGGSGGKRGEVG